MRAEGRRGKSVVGDWRGDAVVRATLVAAEQPLLRSLAERWGDQRQGEDEQQANGDDAAHLKFPNRKSAGFEEDWR